MKLLEFLIKPYLPQLAKILAVFVVIMSGYEVINISGGIPKVDNRYVSKNKSLIIICISGGVLLLIIEPILESTILSILNQHVELTLPVIFLSGGLALLKFNEKMKWDYSKHAYACIIIGASWIAYTLNIISFR